MIYLNLRKLNLQLVLRDYTTVIICGEMVGAGNKVRKERERDGIFLSTKIAENNKKFFLKTHEMNNCSNDHIC